MLTKEQIEYLHNFCISNSVLYYDVQVELVDHLANAVEQEMKIDTNLTFENALHKVHISFGYKGFELLVKERQRVVKKQSRRLFWNIFKSRFRWPQILLFFVLIIGMFNLFSIDELFIKIVFVIVLFGGWALGIYEMIYKKRVHKKTGYEFVTNDVSSLTWILISGPTYLNLVHILIGKNLFGVVVPNILIPSMSILLGLYIIIIIAIWQTIISVRKNLYKTYPQIFSTVK